VSKGIGAEMSNERGNYEGSSRKKGVGPWSAGNHTIDVRPKNWLTPVALLTLREKSSYGYELMDRIARFGFEAINPGTLYRALRHMETEGLCESKWETSNGSGPACRVYSVTEAGEAYLDSWAEGCKKYQKVLDAFYLAYS
jgi:PadR family transcriptional regulator, regulatory protein PadR